MTMLDVVLPTDDEAYKALRDALIQGKAPCDLLHEGARTNLRLREVIERYPKTLALLSTPEGKAWLMSDMERVIEYLVELSQSR